MRSMRLMRRSARVRNASILPPWLASSDAYKEILGRGYRHHRDLDLKHGPPTPRPICGRPKQRSGKTLLDTLPDHRAEVLRFIDDVYDFEVRFTHNRAERNIRMLKVRLKISSCFRKIHATEEFSKICGIISTVRRQEASVFWVLRSSVLGPVSISNGLAPAYDLKTRL